MPKIFNREYARASQSINGRGRAIDYIRPFAIEPGDTVFLVCRVSRRQQKTHLKHQEQNLRALVEAAGGIVAGSAFHHCGSGFDLEVDNDPEFTFDLSLLCNSDFLPQRHFGDPDWLNKATAEAKRSGAKFMLAESTDRFMRHPDYKSDSNPNAQARARDLVSLGLRTYGMELMTAVHPDALTSEVRSYHQRRGRDATGRRGGRPRKKTPGYMVRRREDKMPQAQQLRRDGLSYGEIAKALGLARSTVQRWTQDCKSTN